MLRRLCVLLVGLLLAFGQPLHHSVCDRCLDDQDQPFEHHHHHCQTDFSAAVCQTACNSAASLPSQDAARRLPTLHAVEFFPRRDPHALSTDIPPEPFPPRTSILG